jgi:hypothetical protein
MEEISAFFRKPLQVTFRSRLLSEPAARLCEGATLAALIESFCGADVISFSAQFALWCGRSRALLAWTRLGLRHFLAPAREAWFPDGDARATSAFRTTLATVGFAIVGISFSRPLVLYHFATGTRG